MATSITDAAYIEKLSDWYNARWEEASEVKAELLRTIERHLREYPPFTVYAKALHAYFRGREKPADEWEEKESVIYQTLSQYQKDAYHAALQIADTWNGALICDGVGIRIYWGKLATRCPFHLLLGTGRYPHPYAL